MALFAAAILTGTDASKSSVSPAPSSLTEGRLFFATDTGIVYRDNGSAFVDMDVAGGGATPFSTPPTTGLAAPDGGTAYALPSVSVNPTGSFYFVNGRKMIYGTTYTITTASGVSTLNWISTTITPPNTGDLHELYYS
jgi:hypothetical protein